MTEANGYADWRSLELAIKEAAKKAAREAGPGVSAATVDAQIRQARFDRFLSRVFVACPDHAPPRTWTWPHNKHPTWPKPSGRWPGWSTSISATTSPSG